MGNTTLEIRAKDFENRREVKLPLNKEKYGSVVLELEYKKSGVEEEKEKTEKRTNERLEREMRQKLEREQREKDRKEREKEELRKVLELEKKVREQVEREKEDLRVRLEQEQKQRERAEAERQQLILRVEQERFDRERNMRMQMWSDTGSRLDYDRDPYDDGYYMSRLSKDRRRHEDRDDFRDDLSYSRASGLDRRRDVPQHRRRSSRDDNGSRYSADISDCELNEQFRILQRHQQTDPSQFGLGVHLCSFQTNPTANRKRHLFALIVRSQIPVWRC
jgi:chemotaxis protein histidine kinase CheA